MANQDPQPEVYTTTHAFAGAAATGTSNVISVFTNQANNEEVRLYAIGVELLDATTGAALAAGLDYSVSIQVGPNNVPSNAFSAGFIFSKNDRTLALSTPILVLFQQPLQITVTTNQVVAANGSNVKNHSNRRTCYPKDCGSRWKLGTSNELDGSSRPPTLSR